MITSLRASYPAQGHGIWDATDRPPAEETVETDPIKATLTGQIPTRAHLAEGRFAPRWFFEEMTQAAEAWLADESVRDDGRLPVFWISGRSGSGKSVALLHLLASLHDRDSRRTVIWLDQRGGRMADAISWARPFFAEGREVILAADDPYTPERHQLYRSVEHEVGPH